MTMATVRLAGDKLDPKFVTSVLDIQPEVAASKGKPLRPQSKSKALAPTGTWFLSIDSQDQLPSDALQYLVTKIGENLSRLKGAIPDLSVSFTLLTLGQHYTESDLPGPLVSMARAIGSLELSAG